MLFIPEEGVNHPNFERLAESEALDLLLVFDLPLDSEMSDFVQELFNIWAAKTPWQNFGGTPSFLISPGNNSVRIGLANVRHPQTPLKALIGMLERSPLEIQKILVSHKQISEDGKPIKDLDDIRMRRHVDYTNPKKWWKACFDDELPPPLTEPKVSNKGLADIRDELKGMKIFLEGYRVAYGKPLKAKKLSPNHYCDNIAYALSKRLLAYFDPRSCPDIQNCHGQTGTVDLMFYKGRTGYRLEIRQNELTEKIDNEIRLREYEVLLAIRDLIRFLRFAPAIQWFREEGRDVFFFWEEKVRKP